MLILVYPFQHLFFLMPKFYQEKKDIYMSQQDELGFDVALLI